MTDAFDADFGVDEWHGTNAFIRDGDRGWNWHDNYGEAEQAPEWLAITGRGSEE